MAKKVKSKEVAAEAKRGEVQPARRAMSPFEDMEQYFERLFPGRWFSPLHWERPHWPDIGAAFEGRMPRVDVIDRDDEGNATALHVKVSEGTFTLRIHRS